MGWLNTARNSVTAITFIVAVGFGSTLANAIAGGQPILVLDMYHYAYHERGGCGGQMSAIGTEETIDRAGGSVGLLG